MNDERCELSDLPASQCGCRVHAPKPQRRSVMGNDDYYVFAAKYTGRCSACLQTIHVGELIGPDDDGGYEHMDCGS